jgi:translation initiation factor 2-alpha kinase 4
MIGHGGFGEVVKVKNRLDGNFYAVKKVLLDSWDRKANGKILREVTTLSRLHHQHVVRYFQAWIEGTEQEEIEALLARAQVRIRFDFFFFLFFLTVLLF